MTTQEGIYVSRLRRWLGRQKYRVEQWGREVAYQTATRQGQRVVRAFWEAQAQSIHEQWGNAQHDFPLLRALLHRYQPTTLLDVGCGSGRLFGLYRAQGIANVVGMDLSVQALALAKARYPGSNLVQGKVEAMALPVNAVDLAVCNRVLQHIPPHAIAGAIAQLCTCCRLVYLNELTEQDGLREEFFMFRHPYLQLFAAQGFHRLETGILDQQRYQVFGKKVTQQDRVG